MASMLPQDIAAIPPLPASATLAARILRKRTEVAIIACASIIYFFAYFQRVAVPGTIFDELQSSFKVGAGAVANLGAIYLYIYGSMQLFAGMLNDRIGALRVVLLGGLLLSLGSLAFPLAQSLPLLYAARAVVGLGASLLFLSVVKALDGLFGARHFPRLLGIIMFVGAGGGLCGTLPFERLVSLWSWRSVLLGVGILCALAMAATALLFRHARQGEHRPSASSGLLLRGVLRNRHIIPMVIALPLNFAIYFLLQATLGKKFLLDYAGISSEAAASFTFIMMLVSMCLMAVGPFLLELFSNRRKPLIILSVGCTVLAILLLLVGLRAGLGGGWFLMCYILLALSLVNSPVGNILMRELNPPEILGTSLGLLNGGCYLAVALLTTAAGALLDRFRAGATVTATAVIYPQAAYQAIFALCLVLALVAFIAACFVRETRGVALCEN